MSNPEDGFDVDALLDAANRQQQLKDVFALRKEEFRLRLINLAAIELSETTSLGLLDAEGRIGVEVERAKVEIDILTIAATHLQVEALQASNAAEEEKTELSTSVKQSLQTSMVAAGRSHAWWQLIDEVFPGESLTLNVIGEAEAITQGARSQQQHNAEVKETCDRMADYLGEVSDDRRLLLVTVASHLLISRLHSEDARTRASACEEARLLVLEELGPDERWLAMVDYFFTPPTEP